MNYHEKLSPWIIIRLQPSLQHATVCRFRRRGDAEGYLRVLQRMMPEMEFMIVFDISDDRKETPLTTHAED